MAYRRVASAGELFVGEKASVVVDGKRVLLVRLEGEIVAYEDRCAHRGALLSEGRLEGAILVCAAHEWRYDVCTGAGLNPQGIRLCRYAVKVEGPDVLVDVEPRESEIRSTVG